MDYVVLALSLPDIQTLTTSDEEQEEVTVLTVRVRRNCHVQHLKRALQDAYGLDSTRQRWVENALTRSFAD